MKMPTNSEYWAKRIDEVVQKKFDLTHEYMEKETKKIYAKVSQEIVKEVENLYFKLLDEELSRTEIWTYKHYRDLANSINLKMVKLGLKEIDILNFNLEEALREIYNDVPLPKVSPVQPSFSELNDVMVQQIVSRQWSEKHFTSTVWDNKSELVKILKKGITDCIVKGQSKDKLVEVVKEKMKVGFNRADMVVRTELMHTLNEGSRQRYKDNGYSELEILVAEDERLCPSCGAKEGKIVGIDSSDVPPFHPRCRCTTIPVLAEEDKKDVSNNSESGIITVDRVELIYKPNTITQKVNSKGGIDRNYYGSDARQIKQISDNNHGNPKKHPFGKKGEHAHDYIYDNEGVLIDRPIREINELERKENEDIL